jgi:protein-tyrosine phosphatase
VAWPGDPDNITPDPPLDSGQPFRILMLCTGNICRSPLAEHILAVQAERLSLHIEVSSAGTHAMVGGSVPQEIQEVFGRLEAGVMQHNPRQLTAEIALSSDVILTATREHRKFVVSLAPRTASNAFTMSQFARLLRGYTQILETGDVKPALSLRHLIRELADIRGLVLPPDLPEDDDIADPYRQGQAAYDAAGLEISASMAFIGQALAAIDENSTQA